MKETGCVVFTKRKKQSKQSCLVFSYKTRCRVISLCKCDYSILQVLTKSQTRYVVIAVNRIRKTTQKNSNIFSVQNTSLSNAGVTPVLPTSLRSLNPTAWIIFF